MTKKVYARPFSFQGLLCGFGSMEGDPTEEPAQLGSPSEGSCTEKGSGSNGPSPVLPPQGSPRSLQPFLWLQSLKPELAFAQQ